jgi:hypothetical protein
MINTAWWKFFWFPVWTRQRLVCGKTFDAGAWERENIPSKMLDMLEHI